MNTAVKTAPSEKPSSCLARQPILSKDEKVLGYELLFRESPQEDRFNTDFEGGTRQYYRHFERNGTRCGVRGPPRFYQLLARHVVGGLLSAAAC